MDYQEQYPDKIKSLIEYAKDNAQNARVHLSKYRVGAVIVDEQDMMHHGCNIEFDTYSATIHAEDAAIACMFTCGSKVPKMIVVVTYDTQPWFPCGRCRQNLFELGGPDLIVVAANGNDGSYIIKTMGEILPDAFHL